MTRIASIVAGGASLALSTLPALAQQTGGAPASPGPGYGYYHHMWGWHGGMFFGPLLWILVLCAVIALVARMFGWRHHGYYRRAGGGALDMLEERFARGEIDKAEFEERRKTLGR
ncbi:MAG TPA: SHOCT domain-containing protein [Stellaceae bacterium]|jgi:putative membrane protein|nr:SHOCT domain-containing protein [Stellaceae bacterium]